MNNFYVRYLKRFLNAEMQRTSNVLSKFDKNDLSLLIKYLNLPNVENMFTVRANMLQEFPDIADLFTEYMGNNEITWTSKS
jgi:hypothetical protein